MDNSSFANMPHPPKYKTEEERYQAKLEAKRKYGRKRYAKLKEFLAANPEIAKQILPQRQEVK